MTPTPWDVRNKLLAILNGAQRSGKPYVDVESANLDKELGDDTSSHQGIPVCQDVMTKMMRTGDLILRDTANGEGPTIMIRYIFDAKHET